MEIGLLDISVMDESQCFELVASGVENTCFHKSWYIPWKYNKKQNISIDDAFVLLFIRPYNQGTQIQMTCGPLLPLPSQWRDKNKTQLYASLVSNLL